MYKFPACRFPKAKLDSISTEFAISTGIVPSAGTRRLYVHHMCDARSSLAASIS